MIENNYELRSRDVQEVMKAPPSAPIMWGNSIILLGFVISLVLADTVNIRARIKLPFKIESVAQNVQKHVSILELSMWSTIPDNLKLNERVIINLETLPDESGSIQGTITAFNREINNMECTIGGNNTLGIFTDKRKKVSVGKGMMGYLQIDTGAVSIARLFYRKISNK